MSNLIDANELYIRIREQVKSPAIVGCLGGIIAEVPTFGLDDLRPKGRWENVRMLTTGDGRVRMGFCSCCGSAEKLRKYCPNCGADMRGGGEDV